MTRAPAIYEGRLTGFCDTCGHWCDPLVVGMCLECRARYQASEYGDVPLGEEAAQPALTGEWSDD